MTSITHATVWSFTGPGLIAVPLEPFGGEPDAQLDVYDLCTDMPPSGYWVGRVVCMGGCRRFVFCAVIERDEPPTRLACPQCKGPAVPDAHWLSGSEISCFCGQRSWNISTTHHADERPKRMRCRYCGNMTDRILPWPLLD